MVQSLLYNQSIVIVGRNLPFTIVAARGCRFRGGAFKSSKLKVQTTSVAKLIQVFVSN